MKCIYDAGKGESRHKQAGKRLSDRNWELIPQTRRGRSDQTYSTAFSVFTKCRSTLCEQYPSSIPSDSRTLDRPVTSSKLRHPTTVLHATALDKD